VSNAAGRAVGGLIDELRQWTKGSEFKAIVKWFKDSGPAAITHFGHAVAHTIEGLGGILSNFAGPGDHAAKTLDRLTKRFAAWGKSKGVSDSVNRFLKYVSGNGPQITSVMQSLAQALPKLAVALGKLGSLNLNAVAMFLNLVAGLPQGAFNAVVIGLFGIVAAAKALTILKGTQALFTGASLAMSAFKDACVLTRIQLAALWVQEKIGAAITKGMAAAQWLLNAAMDANPIGLLVIAIAALVAGFIIAYKKSETFRNIVNGALTGVQKVASKVFDWLKNAVSFVIGFIKSHWMLLLGILGGPIALAAVLIIKHFGQIKSFIGNVLSAIKGIVSNLWGGVVSILRNGADNIVAGIRALPGRIRGLMGAFGDAGRAIIGAFVNGLKNAGGVIQGIAGNVWNALRGLLNAAIDQINRALEFTINPPGPGSISVNAPDIPHLAAGGIVNRPTVALIGEAGPEAVVPLSGRRGGLGGDTYVVVHASGLVDPQTMVRQIERELAKLKRQRGGTLAF
jgi:phage-related protein